ncbi:MAG TPA: hypothetical protein VGY56_12255 [Verrucomicrobiae bacterium]|nr:hypothetical protein [Verrucomicrobiae bacterium]
MRTKKKTQKKNNDSGPEPLRFALPYFTPTPPGRRVSPKAYGQRMTDHIQGTLHPIPAVKGAGTFTLKLVINESSLAITLYGVVDDNTTDVVDGPAVIQLG